MTRKLMAVVVGMGTIVWTGAAEAAPLTIPAGGTWVSMAGITLNEDGTPFWEHPSWDGPAKNIGYQLQALLGADFASLEYLSADAPFQIGGTAEQIRLTVEVAGQQDANRLLYDNGHGDQAIFDGPAGPGTSFAGIIDGPFSFVFYSNGNAATRFATDDAATVNQFALFRLTGTQQYYLGIEDLPLANSDRDYNDMIVAFQLQPVPDPDPVPEPATLLLVGLGLLGGAARLRRR